MTSPRETYLGEIVTTVVLMHKDMGMYEKNNVLFRSCQVFFIYALLDYLKELGPDLSVFSIILTTIIYLIDFINIL